MIPSEDDQNAIARFIAEHGITRVPRGASGLERAIKARFVTQKGPHTPRQRYNIACAYARIRGLESPIWTDQSEAELKRLRALGLSYREIANLMGRTKGAIQARVRYLALGRRLQGKTRAGKLCI